MLNEHQIEQLKLKYEKYCASHCVDSSVYDINAKIDRQIAFDENWEIIETELDKLAENGTLLKNQVKSIKAREKKEIDKTVNSLKLNKKILNDLKVMFITSDTGEGKTAISYYFLENLKKYKEIYVFKHPKPELVTKLGYKNMYSIDEIENLRNVILWVDEPQIVFPKYEKRGSIVLNKLLSLSRQKDIVLILSTSDTRYITASEEFYVSTYIIKKIDYQMIKRGSKVKQIINDVSVLTPEGFSDNIKLNEFVFYNRRLKEMNGKHTFRLPKFFNESYSKPFS